VSRYASKLQGELAIAILDLEVNRAVFLVRISDKRFDKSFKARFLLSRSLMLFYSCFFAFSRTCGFFSLFFLLTAISLQRIITPFIVLSFYSCRGFIAVSCSCILGSLCF
jgi:hypothetical protein